MNSKSRFVCHSKHLAPCTNKKLNKSSKVDKIRFIELNYKLQNYLCIFFIKLDFIFSFMYILAAQGIPAQARHRHLLGSRDCHPVLAQGIRSAQAKHHQFVRSKYSVIVILSALYIHRHSVSLSICKFYL